MNVISKLWMGFKLWTASSRSTIQIFLLAGSALLAAVVYIQNLRVKAARCELSKDLQEQVESIGRALERELAEDRDERIDHIEDAQDTTGCLDLDVDRLLHGDPVEGS